MKRRSFVLNNETDVLKFLKARYPLYHLSTVSFRDIQYGIQTFLDRKDMRVGYQDAERIAGDFVAALETKKVLVRIDRQTWALHYPEFRTPQAKSPVAATPATAPAKPAAGTSASPKPGLPPLNRTPAGRPASAQPALPPLNRPAAPPAQKVPPPAADKTAEQTPPESTASAPSVPSPAPETTKDEQKAQPPLPPKPARPLPPITSSTPAKTRK